MGTASVQGPLWGGRARDWADQAEPASRPQYEAVFDALSLGPGRRLLDIGCGAGLAAQLAAARGAQVSGLDASSALIEIARERVPTGDFRVGDLEALPYADQTFDIVTGFNSFQFAADPVAALREARRVARSAGRVTMLIWGRPADCETPAVMGAVIKLLPPPPPDAPAPVPMSEPGQLEAIFERAGLRPIASGEVACPFEFPDLESALRAMQAPGPAVRAAQLIGADRLRQVLSEGLAPFRTPGGSYRMRNTFRYLIGTPAG